MACVHPIPAVFQGYKLNKDGQRVKSIKLLDMRHRYFGYGLEELRAEFGEQLVLLPCGHCYSCGIDYSRMWSSRIMLESQHHAFNCFLTLTYSDQFLPSKLEKRPLQLFMKRLRKQFPDRSIRFFACGEVGEGKGSRKYNPHYHVILFGFDFEDKVLLKRSSSGMMIYRSSLLEQLWPYGMSSIGSLTVESAQYVAKYSLKKKVSGKDDGEFVLMSRRPGIGASSYSEDIWLTDHVYVSGQTFKPPRFYEKIAEASGSFSFALAKEERHQRSLAIKSSKFKYGLAREEFALIKENDDRIVRDARKVRLVNG